MTAHTFQPASGLAISAQDPPRSSAPPVVRTSDAARHKDRIEYRLIFVAAFAVFLLASAIERLSPSRWSDKSEGASSRKSVVAQAKESASIAVGYAFMG